MAYPTRTLSQLSSAAWGFINQTIPGAVVSVWPQTFQVLAKVLALLDFENEQRRAWLARQLFASTADEEWLLRHGWELGLVPDPATAAIGTATVSCTAGLTIPKKLQFQRSDGSTYSVRTPTTPTGSTVSLPLEADVAGAVGNTAAATTLALVPSAGAPAGLGATATVDAAGITGGADAQKIESFQSRVLYRKRNTAQGGSVADFVEWTEAALPTVTGVWVDQFVGDAGHVWLTFTVSDQPGGIPTSGQVAIVQAYLSDFVRRPVTARVTVVAPTAQYLGVVIAGLYPDTPDTRAAVWAELQAAFDELAAPATPNQPTIFYLLWIEAAINRAVGVQRATVTNPTVDTTYSTGGNLPVFNGVSFI